MTRELAEGSASPHDMKTNQHRPDAFPAGQAHSWVPSSHVESVPVT